MAAFHAGFDHSRAARQVLFDFVDGQLLYCNPPPSQPDLQQYHFPEEAAVTTDDVTLSLHPAAASVAAASAGGKPSSLLHASVLKPVNVMDIQDTDGMFDLPLPKHKSKKTSVITSHHRRRKGERDPDPYGCLTPSDPMESLVHHYQGARVKTHGAKGEMREETTFIRVQRPYSSGV